MGDSCQLCQSIAAYTNTLHLHAEVPQASWEYLLEISSSNIGGSRSSLCAPVLSMHAPGGGPTYLVLHAT